MPAKSIAVVTQIDVDSARAVLTHDFRRCSLDGRHEFCEQLRFGVEQGFDPLDGFDHEMPRRVGLGGSSSANCASHEDDAFGIGDWGSVVLGEQ